MLNYRTVFMCTLIQQLQKNRPTATKTFFYYFERENYKSFKTIISPVPTAKLAPKEQKKKTNTTRIVEEKPFPTHTHTRLRVPRT